MKVLIGVHHFPPVYRGAEWRAHRLASALQEAGHEASVICVERIDDAQAAPLAYADEVFEGVAVRRLSFDLGAAPDPLHWEYDNLWVGEHLRQVFDERKPDLFHLIGGYLLTGSAARCPTGWAPNSCYADRLLVSLSPLLHAAHRWCYLHAAD
ncbi:MAG: glycosyltransferase [Anaerolineales bacterium]|nr:glycosyltransferase [Anaerolineales bacterium]